MSVGKKKLLAVFLEKDNVKLLVYDVFGNRPVRQFAGQITFSPEVVKDAYIADSAKFSGQIKMAISAKEWLRQSMEAVLFLPPDKTFTKSLPASDTVDSFIQSLPYFAEELILSTEQLAARGKGLEKVTHIAFEKKLVEDLERPFLESGKTVLAVKSGVNVLAASYIQTGKYFLLVPLDKEIAVAVAQDGAVSEVAAIARDVFATRFGEFVLNHNLGAVTQAYTLGVFDANLAGKIRSERGIEIVSLASGDIYDLAVSAYLRRSGGGILANLLGRISLPAIGERLPNQKYLFLVGAGIAGILLVVLLVKGIGGMKLGGSKPVSPMATTPALTPVPEPKPGDFKVRVLNGTLVEGEAGRLASVIKDKGFEVTETKNATSAGFVATRLRTAADVPAKIVEAVKSALNSYESINLELLASDSAGVKIEIIIGKKI